MFVIWLDSVRMFLGWFIGGLFGLLWFYLLLFCYIWLGMAMGEASKAVALKQPRQRN